MTKIQWTTKTWNPTVGCSKVSAGCVNCYAIKDVHRMASNPNQKISSAYAGLTERRGDRTEWTGKVNFLSDRLEIPLRTREPTTWFVNSMSDLFHDAISDEQLDQIFAVMALTPQHTYQVLTKRPERMQAYFSKFLDYQSHLGHAGVWASEMANFVCDRGFREFDDEDEFNTDAIYEELTDAIRGGFLDNVWLGVSVENQKAADDRIPLLLKTPAAIRFLSCEPLLGDVDLSDALHWSKADDCHLDWVIVGGESGHDARVCASGWLQSIVEQCQVNNVACFVKQLGGFRFGYGDLSITDKKGGIIDEFPESLQVRQYPASVG